MKTDILIWDSTPGGILAAVAAARAGAAVTIVTQDRHIGGLQTSGLGNTNAGRRETVGGLAREFHDRIHNCYQQKYGPDSQQVRDCREGFFFEPHVAEQVFEQWLSELNVTVLRGHWLAGLTCEGPRIRALRTDRGLEIQAGMFIDASYEGDLLAVAGCSFHIGRESVDTYGEDLAGIRYPPAEQGRADQGIQPYDYRLCLTDDPDNRIEPTRPVDYDPARYAYLAARYQAVSPQRASLAVPLNMMPNRKTDSRTGEWVGAGWHYAQATPEHRRAFEQAQRRFSEGFFWFARTDPSVPSHLRQQLEPFGYAADEFTDNDHWPWHIYVREGRRLVGEYVMTQADVTEQRDKPDSVALGSFYLDVHPVRWVPSPEGIEGVMPDGQLPTQRVRPYAIAYRALLPRREQAENLLVPVALSASHVGFSTIRMEPVWGMLGHAAGLAAAKCLSTQRLPHELSIQGLQGDLLAQKQIIDPTPFADLPPL